MEGCTSNPLEHKPRQKEIRDRKKPHGTTLLTKGDYVAYEPDLQANLDMAELKKRNKAKLADEDRKFANDVKQKILRLGINIHKPRFYSIYI